MLFTDISATTIASGVNRIDTDGYRTVGFGAATYFRWASPLATLPSPGTGENEWWTTSADGAKWYPDPHNLRFSQFGSHGDGTWDVSGNFVSATDDYPAFLAFKSMVGWARQDDGDRTQYLSAPSLFIEEGTYYTSGTWDLTDATYHIVCAGFGVAQQNGGNPVTLASAAGVTTVEIESIRTTGTTSRSPGIGGEGTSIIGLRTWGTGVGDNPDANGFYIRGIAQLIRCSALNHPGDGLRIVGSAGAGGSDEGDPNGCLVEGGDYCFNGRNGIFIDGADSNAGAIRGPIFCNINAQWGLYDSAFLINTSEVIHARTNGFAGSGPLYNPNVWGCACYYDGNFWYVQVGKADEASTTEPGTDDTVWALIGPGEDGNPRFPTWVTGHDWNEGGPFHSDSPSSMSCFFSCYSEDEGLPSVFSQSTLIIGGLHGGPVQGGAWLRAFGTNIRGDGCGFDSLRTDSTGTRMLAQLGGNSANNDVISAQYGALQPWTLNYSPTSGNLRWLYQHSDSFRPFEITGPNTTYDGGRHVTTPHAFYLPEFFLGPIYRSITLGSAAPTSGDHAIGEIVFNGAATAGGKIGWVCVTAGTPGTWKAFGAIDV